MQENLPEPNPTTISVTHSSRNCANQCLYKYFIKYVLLLKPIEKSEALDFGSDVHDYLEQLAKENWQIEPIIENLYNPENEIDEIKRAKIHAVLVNFLELPNVAVEMEPEMAFSIELMDDAPYKFMLSGKIDGIHKYIREYKTTAKLDDEFWRRIINSTQGTTYSIATKFIKNLNEYMPIEYFGISKPKIRLKKSESIEEYTDRLIEATEIESKIVHVTNDMIARWAGIMQEHCKTLKLAYANNHFPKSYNCTSFHRMCDFAPHCHSGVPIEEITILKSSQHEELEKNGNTK